MMKSLFVLMAAAVLAMALPADARTVYKLTDKTGKVTYSSEEPPKDYEGKVVKIEIDMDANTAKLSRPTELPPSAAEISLRKRLQESKRADDRIESARVALDEAKKALVGALENPGENDIRFLGNVGGGARRIFSEEYQERLARLDANVKKAEEELDRAMRAIK